MSSSTANPLYAAGLLLLAVIVISVYWEVAQKLRQIRRDEVIRAVASAVVIAVWLFGALMTYGVVVIIFRYAFGVELWNPFH
jgi:hypothetical protein